jgi:hypothetical protein
MPANTIFSTLTTPPIRLANGRLDTRPGYRGGVAPGGGGVGNGGTPSTTPGEMDIVLFNGRDIGGYLDVREPDGSLIFDADFTNRPDWQAQHTSQRYRYLGDSNYNGTSGYIAADNVPAGFDFYYMSEAWHPNGDQDGVGAVVGSQPVAQISNLHGAYNDPAGKSFIMYDELYGSPTEWKADSVTTKDIGYEVKALWVECRIRFQPDYWWAAIANDTNDQSTMKLFRCRRHSNIETNNRFEFFGASARSGSPVFIQDLYVWGVRGGTNRMRNKPVLRGYMHPTDYNNGVPDYYSMFTYRDTPDEYIRQGGAENLTWEQTLGDGEFHKLNFYVEMDSAPGAGDGKYEMWLDDILEQQVLDIPWRQAGDPTNIGWNEVSIGGNINNFKDAPVNTDEQWYQVSDLKIWNGKPT